MNQPIISIRNLVKNFGQGDNLTRVLRGLDINIYSGEFVIIFGPSGSGKSTLLNIINGLETPTSGDVIIDGQNLTTLSDAQKAEFHRDKIGMVFQAYNLISSLTVLQNITLPLVFAKVEKRQRVARANELLRSFGLEKLANRLPSEISGGQMQRVGIMRALVNHQPIIVADEPTGNLDSVATKVVMELFTDLNRQYQNTLIVVTHDSSLFAYADRIIHILDGQVVKETVRQKSTTKSKLQSTSFDNFVAEETNKNRRRYLDILAMVLSRNQLASFDEIELSRTLDLIDRRLKQQISSSQFYELLDKPVKQGGAGLYQPTTKYLSESLDNILKIVFP
jgi:putative ABC transport system ATP-binding protein